jgi:DNA-binding MarR family transcriptional regulator
MIVHVISTSDESPVPVPGSDLIDGIFVELHRSMNLLKCAGAGRLVKQGISMTHVHVLWILEEHGELAMSRIAELIDVSLSNGTGLIDRMEERGLVERARDPEDRRVVLVRLSDGGRATLDEIQVVRAEVARAILERLDEGQLQRLQASLHDFRTAIQAEADAHPGLFEGHHPHAHVDQAQHGESAPR